MKDTLEAGQRQYNFTSNLSEPGAIGAILSIIPILCAHLRWPQSMRSYITAVLAMCLGEMHAVEKRHADFAKELYPDAASDEAAEKKFKRARSKTEQCFTASGFTLFVCIPGKRTQSKDGGYSSLPSRYQLTAVCADFLVNVFQNFDEYDVLNGADSRSQKARVRRAVIQSVSLFGAQPIPRKPHQKRTSSPIELDQHDDPQSPSSPELHTDEPYEYDRRTHLEQKRDEENEFFDQMERLLYERLWLDDDLYTIDQRNELFERIIKVGKRYREAMRHRVQLANEPRAAYDARMQRLRAEAKAEYEAKWGDLIESSQKWREENETK